jgi:hypothetical protein
MDITVQDVLKFQALYKIRFGRDVDDRTAKRKLNMLVRQMEVIYRPITKDQLDELKNDNYESTQTSKHQS